MKKPNIQKIDLLFQYVLAVAGQEDWGNRELGMIHLIKYLYLADLAYAKHHDGETYTGLAWEFYNFGPWAEEAYRRIEPALFAIGAEKKIYPSTKREKDCVRWSIQNDELYDELDKKLNITITGAIQLLVHKFGSDTEGLLHFVYKTKPMLQAAPGEILDFINHKTADLQQDQSQDDTPSESLSTRQLKKRKEKLSDIKKRLRERLDEKKGKVRFFPTPPRHDAIFFEGVNYLDSLAGEPIEPLEGTLIIADEVWKSKARHDPDVPG
ncbi:MAG: hypothetical protein ISS65_08530 [Desulfobacterales bacterium]|uniref:DUF4065 domain-containing protein n=1 Tax=Candidatus Desulfatibia profunda TaxID=2841695 RepID=A0A8J6NSP8_9BACT|nr:hypothetical protein [Candidatus Desulfatibia profunda]MBL7180239.1 hypothetical protein [Desulfobacterales bacterium]